VKVKLDENLGRSHCELLRGAGYTAERIAEQDLSGAEDEVVWEHICSKGYFFITLDLDFSDVRKFPPGTHPGILILRPRSKGKKAVGEVLARVLKEHRLEPLKGCIAVADEVKTRVRCV